MRTGRTLFPALLALVCLSCNIVKEDRELCPCNLTINVTGAPGDVRLMLQSRSFVMDEVVPGDTSVTWRVPRPDIRITAVCGAEWSDGVFIKEGGECPPLYLGVGRVGTDAENVTCSPPLYKSYCLIDMHFNCPPGWKDFPVRLSGNVCGYGTAGTPVRGVFSCEAEPGVEGRCGIRVPRQTDSSLLLTLGRSWTFALGEYLRESGYDWSRPDLPDVEVNIDISLTDISFHIRNWSHTEQLWFLI